MTYKLTNIRYFTKFANRGPLATFQRYTPSPPPLRLSHRIKSYNLTPSSLARLQSIIADQPQHKRIDYDNGWTYHHHSPIHYVLQEMD